MDLFERIIYEDSVKCFQLRLVVNTFRDVEYFHIRKYFLDIDGEWIPSKEGISIPANIESIYNLLAGLVEIVSRSEIKHIIDELVKSDE